MSVLYGPAERHLGDRLTTLGRLSIVVVVGGCGSAVSTTATSPAAVVTSGSSIAPTPAPCSFLTQQTAALISGDSRVTNQASDVMETPSGYVACIFTDTMDEANSVAVQIKRVPGGAGPSALRAAATYFSAGEPVQPFQPFAVAGIGDDALGETTPGVTFIVFSHGDVLVYVGAESASVSGTALRGGVAHLAAQIAAAL